MKKCTRNASNLTSSRVHHYYARWIHEYASIPSFVRLFFLTHYTTTYLRGLFFILRPTKKTRKQLQMGIFFSFRIRGFDFGFDSRGKHAISLVRKKSLDKLSYVSVLYYKIKQSRNEANVIWSVNIACLPLPSLPKYIYIFVSTTFTEKILYALQITWRNAGSTFRFTYARVNVENEIYRWAKIAAWNNQTVITRFVFPPKYRESKYTKVRVTTDGWTDHLGQIKYNGVLFG